MYISKDLRKIGDREELTLIFKLAYIRNKVTRTSNARCLDPKGEVSIMKPARVLWARKYLMKLTKGSKCSLTRFFNVFETSQSNLINLYSLNYFLKQHLNI